jgi:hypothetical protein
MSNDICTYRTEREEPPLKKKISKVVKPRFWLITTIVLLLAMGAPFIGLLFTYLLFDMRDSYLSNNDEISRCEVLKHPHDPHYVVWGIKLRSRSRVAVGVANNPTEAVETMKLLCPNQKEASPKAPLRKETSDGSSNN